MNLRTATALAFALAACASAAHATTVIDTVPVGITPASATYRAQCCVVSDRTDLVPGTLVSNSMGTTFRTGSNGDLRLDSFSLFLRQYALGYQQGATLGTMNFRAHVGTWQHLGTNPSPQGDLIDIVYSSAITTTVNDFSIQKFTFNAGVQLLPNQWYIAFISPEGLAPQAVRSYEMPVSWDGNPFPTQSSNLWTKISYDNFNSLSTEPWQAGWGPAWFQATLTAPVPEPASAVLLLAGAAALVAVRRRRPR